MRMVTTSMNSYRIDSPVQDSVFRDLVIAATLATRSTKYANGIHRNRLLIDRQIECHSSPSLILKLAIPAGPLPPVEIVRPSIVRFPQGG